MELSALNLADDFKEAQAVEDSHRWELSLPNSLEVLATVSPISSPQERFQARLLWSKYPDEPPSIKFRDPETGRLDLTKAWPIVRGFRPGSFDTCVNWSAEGFQLHPEWRNDPKFRWDPRGNVLLKILRILVSELDNHYQARST